MKKKHIALLSNITTNLICTKLKHDYDFYQPDGFDTWVQEVINPLSNLYSLNLDSIIVLLDGTESKSWKGIEEANERLSVWKSAFSTLVDNITSIPIFATTLDIQENRIKSFSERQNRVIIENDWSQFLHELVEERDNVFVIDLADIIYDHGRNLVYSNKMWYLSNMPFSRDGINVVCEEIKRALSSAFGSRRKIISLDLDNTIWGGVIGEDGIERIELSNHKEGQRYYDFQRQLLEMRKRGILLAINSKNNDSDAEEAIRNHPYMLLHDEDFVCKKINWQNKAVNIKEMETELNITEGGFIFIDDNPLERETIIGACPEVLVPSFPNDTSELLALAERIWFDYCKPLRVLCEDLQKTKMYQIENERKKEYLASLSLDEYVARLGIIVDIHLMRPSEFERVVQLFNKTNQFNLTTKRYSHEEVNSILNNPNNKIYVTCCSDKFGDSGLIAIIVLNEEPDRVTIDSFLMSCRVMGRMIENVIINEIAASYNSDVCLLGEYIPTSKNKPVEDLYERLGFTVISETHGQKKYELNLKDFKKKSFNVFKEIRFEDGN